MLQEHLFNLGVLLPDSDETNIIQALRQIVVNEFLSNAGRYKHALLSPDKHFEDEVNKYRECGYFTSKYLHIIEIILLITVSLC